MTISEMTQDATSTKLFTLNSKEDYYPWFAIAFVIAVAVTVLNIEGRVWWCQAADLVPWSWDIWSMHNSQHLVDPYSFTHILHGVLEFWIIGLIFRRIQRYREATISLDYFGDSIINSMSDIFCCATGFVIAYKLGFWRSLVLFIATETILIFWIHDSLLINILMLVYPIEVVKHWQMGG